MKQRTKNVLIRLLYLIPLLFFMIGLITSFDIMNSFCSLGIKYKYVFMLPIIIFTYQTIRNSLIGWILVMILYLSYLTIWIYGLIDKFSMIGAKYTYGQYFSWWFFVLIYIGIGVIYIKFRPKKLII